MKSLITLEAENKNGYLSYYSISIWEVQQRKESNGLYNDCKQPITEYGNCKMFLSLGNSNRFFSTLFCYSLLDHENK